MGIATLSKFLCTLKVNIAEGDDLRMIDMCLNGMYVLICYVATSDNSKFFLFHAFSPHTLQTTIEIQKIFLVHFPAKLVEKLSRGTRLSFSLFPILIESQNCCSQLIAGCRLKVAYHLIAEVILHGLQ